MLLSTDAPILSISKALGFNTPVYFLAGPLNNMWCITTVIPSEVDR